MHAVSLCSSNSIVAERELCMQFPQTFMQTTAVGVEVGVALGATTVMYDWWMELVNLKEEWRCAL